MLQITNLHASIEDKIILRGLNLVVPSGEVHSIMGPNGAGKSTLSNVLTGHPKYKVLDGSITLDGQDILAMAPEERAQAGLLMSFQYPVEIPGVSMLNFLRTAVNARRQAKGMEPMNASEFLRLIREKQKIVEMPNELASRSVNVGFSGGEKKRNEIFQMLLLEPAFAVLDETDSGLDVDALRIVAHGVNSLRDSKFSALVITHYQRLLELIKPDRVHVLMDGMIVKTGGPELAVELDERGYDWVREEYNGSIR